MIIFSPLYADDLQFAGMHDSGKTTFIAAIWDYVNSEKKGKKLILNTLANSENQYLDSIRSEWLKCQKVTRTNLGKIENVRMNLLKSENQENVLIEIPDMSGELFAEHFQSREWSIEYGNVINEVSGILIFINPEDTKNRTNFLADSNALIEALGGEPEGNEDIEFASWNEEMTSNQVKLVETLQFIYSRSNSEFPIKISVIVSRWDLLESAHGETPESWIQLQMPLFFQYLKCNPVSFKSAFYGVSAQGGNYDEPTELEKLRELEAYDRPKVKIDGNFINDLAEPVIWITQD